MNTRSTAVEEHESQIGDSLPLNESALVERFWERIRLFACRRLPTPAEGEDVAQETIRRVLEALRQGRLRAADALPAFVFETARNVCRQRQRSAMREGRAFDRLRGWLSHMDAVADPLANILSESERVAVRAALGRLAADDREVLNMSYYHALDTAEVARRLGATPGAIRVRRYRALHRLRELLGNHR